MGSWVWFSDGAQNKSGKVTLPSARFKADAGHHPHNTQGQLETNHRETRFSSEATKAIIKKIDWLQRKNKHTQVAMEVD